MAANLHTHSPCYSYGEKANSLTYEQVFSTSSGAKKGGKRSGNSSLDFTVNLSKLTLLKQGKKQSKTKKTSIQECKNILKINDFVLYPVKAVIPVPEVYTINSLNINPTRKPLLLKRKTIPRHVTGPSSTSGHKVTKRSSKAKKLVKINSVRTLQLSKSTKRPRRKTNIKNRKTLKQKKNSKKQKKKILKKSLEITTDKTARRPGFANKTLQLKSSYVNTMVLSADQFVFKPTIPITEANYPLDNADKLELYAQDSTVDKVVSYGFSDPAIKNYIKFPSVSKIIEETISDKTKQILANWRQKMIDELGEDGFFNHSEALKVRGTEFHMAVRNAVLGNTSELHNCSEVTQNSLKSLSWMLEHISNPMAVESTIAHPKLGYRGVADCIAMFRNIPVMIDWKLSDKPKRELKDTYDAPVQITAYIGALNHDPNYKWGVNHGLVAVAYANGDPCDVFLLAPKHCQIYWRHWLMRFDKFKDSDYGKRCLLNAEKWIQNNIRYERLRQNRLERQRQVLEQQKYQTNTYRQNTYRTPHHNDNQYQKPLYNKDQVGYRERRTYAPKPNVYTGQTNWDRANPHYR